MTRTGSVRRGKESRNARTPMIFIFRIGVGILVLSCGGPGDVKPLVAHEPVVELDLVEGRRDHTAVFEAEDHMEPGRSICPCDEQGVISGR